MAQGNLGLLPVDPPGEPPDVIDLGCEFTLPSPSSYGGGLGIVAGMGWPSHRNYVVERWKGRDKLRQPDLVVEEVPVALVYNGQPHVVMLATPLDLEDFALGFSLTEGIVKTVSEVQSVRIHNRVEGIEVRMRIPQSRFEELPGKERNLTGRTGCGLCGSATLRQAVRHPAPVGTGVTVKSEHLQAALEEIREQQSLNQLTGTVHAASWVVPGSGILKIREDANSWCSFRA